MQGNSGWFSQAKVRHFYSEKNFQITNERHEPRCPYVHSPYVIACMPTNTPRSRQRITANYMTTNT